MTAPRTPLDEFRAGDEAKLTKLLGLKPSSAAPAQPTHPEPMDIDAIQGELDAFLHRGGRLGDRDYKSPRGTSSGLMVLPNGTYGGEFNDEEVAAMLDAQKKLNQAKEMVRMRRLLESQGNLAQQRPDASAVRPRADGGQR